MMTTAAEPRSLHIDGLSASYGMAQVIHGLSLEVRPGEAVAILGRNGMGKTSLVRCLLGIGSPAQRSGTITWDGTSLVGMPSHQRAKHGIGLVPQGRHVFGSLTVDENLTTTARRADAEQPWTLARVYEFFPRLQERRRSKARNLSGGELLMLAVGRALMTNPRLLVMDEPSEGLAPVVVGQIRDRLQALKGSELSILLVEQNVGLAMALADRIYILELGQIVYVGTPAELRADTELQRKYLGV
jgi:branched-chain amino acid transport system ATP-binding protein